MKFRISKAGRKRMEEARIWYPQQNFNEDSHVMKAYRKKFNVDRICAMKELCALGVLPEEEQKNYEAALMARREKLNRKKRAREERDDLIEQDEYFAYIAGYTSGGFPYGITWEEMEKIEEEEKRMRETAGDDLPEVYDYDELLEVYDELPEQYDDLTEMTNDLMAESDDLPF